ncbi:MAG: polysaccharide deacetylase family protein [Chloroflexi bacterium]|nr:polysaccharide deacetylase family protein [Chloroflexota bacterium]
MNIPALRVGSQHDLYAYTPAVGREKLTWPGGARVAVWVVPNIEHYELSAPDGSIDVPQFSRTDYGNRVGIWRLMRVLDRFGIRGTVALNSAVCRHYPAVVEACLQRDWELMGHGITNSQSLADLGPEAQRELIGSALDEIRRAGGKPVRGWLGPGLHESPATLDLLEAAGLVYTCDWVHDDLPVRFQNGLLSIPYTTDANDIRMLRPPLFGALDWLALVKRAFDVLYAEGEQHPKVMCIALHPFIIGTPGRIGLLEDILQHIANHADVWLTTGGEIVDAYNGQSSASRSRENLVTS